MVLQLALFSVGALCWSVWIWLDLCIHTSQGHQQYVHRHKYTPVKALTHKLFHPYCSGGLSGSDLKWIMCQYRYIVEMAQSISFNLSVPNTACCIPNGWIVSSIQWASAGCTEVKAEVKWRLEVTRDGSFRSGKVEYIDLPFALTHHFQLFCVEASTFKTLWGLNSPPQPYGQNSFCTSTFFAIASTLLYNSGNLFSTFSANCNFH